MSKVQALKLNLAQQDGLKALQSLLISQQRQMRLTIHQLMETIENSLIALVLSKTKTNVYMTKSYQFC